MVVLRSNDLGNGAIEIHVTPGEPEELALACASRDCHDDEEIEPRSRGLPASLEQPRSFFVAQESHDLVPFGRALDTPRRVVPTAGCTTVLDRPSEQGHHSCVIAVHRG